MGFLRRSVSSRNLPFILVGLLVIGLTWARLLDPHHSLFVYQDASDQTYPWWTFAVHEIQAGRLPLWDPYTMGGRSFIGEGQSGALYPPFMLLAWLGGPWVAQPGAIELFEMLHVMIAFVGTFALARTLRVGPAAACAAGLAYALGGFFGYRAWAQLGIFLGTAWIPLIILGLFLAVSRRDFRWGALSGVAVAMSILAGHFEPAFHAALILAVAVPFATLFRTMPDRAPLGLRLGALYSLSTLVVAVSTSAVQLLPTFEYQARAVRWVGVGTPIPANTGTPFAVILINPTVQPGDVFSFFFNVVDRPVDTSLYLGCAVFLLAAIAVVAWNHPSRPLWLVVMALGILAAFADRTPVLWLLEHIPLADRIREPGRYMLLPHLALSLLAAGGLEVAVSKARSRLVAVAMGAGVVAVIGLALAGRWLFPSSVTFGAATVGVASALAVAAVIGVAQLRLVSGPAFLRRWSLRVAPLAVLAIVGLEVGGTWADSVPATPGFDGVVNREVGQLYGGDLPRRVRATLASESGLYRMEVIDTKLPRNWGEAVGVGSVWGYSATAPTLLWKLRSDLGARPGDVGPRLLGVRIFVSATDLPRATLLETIEGQRVYEDPSALPFFWFPSALQPVDDGAAGLRALAAPGFRLGSTAVVPSPAPPLDPVAQGGALVSVDRYEPGSISLRVSCQAQCVLATSEAFYPGWTATANGRPIQQINVNYAFRGLVIPAGVSVVNLTYEPASVKVGAVVSALAMLALLVAVGLSLLRSRPAA